MLEPVSDGADRHGVGRRARRDAPGGVSGSDIEAEGQRSSTESERELLHGDPSVVVVLDATPYTRASDRFLSWESRFVRAWPTVRTRVVRLLTSRGADGDLAEDIVQDVALRAYRIRPTFDSPEELFWWCSTVAKRCAIDEHRRTSRTTAVAHLPEPRRVEDTALTFERTETVRAVLGAFAELPESQQRALTSRDTSASSTDAVRRHRARRRLLAIVDGLAGCIVWLVHRARETGSGTAIASGAAVSVLLVVGVGGSAPRSSNNAPERFTSSAPSAATARLSNSAESTRQRSAGLPSVAPDPLSWHPTLSGPETSTIATTPGGRPWVVVTNNDDENPPLACVHLGTVGVAQCVDYPVRP